MTTPPGPYVLPVYYKRFSMDNYILILGYFFQFFYAFEQDSGLFHARTDDSSVSTCS